MTSYRVEHCPLADQEHRDAKRQYAHVFHRKNAICVAQAFYRLPRKTQVAILLHEAGHLLAGVNGSEAMANEKARAYSGVKLWYKDQPPYGEELEWIRPEDVSKAEEALGL